MGLPQPQPSTADLITGILGDAQELLRKELLLVKQETREELVELRSYAVRAAAGGLLLGLATVLVLIALSQGVTLALAWPSWAGYALVGALAGVVGAVLSKSGAQKLKGEVKSLRPDNILRREEEKWKSGPAIR